MGKAKKGNNAAAGRVTVLSNPKAKVKAAAKRMYSYVAASSREQMKQVQVRKNQNQNKNYAPKQKGPQIFFNDAQKAKATTGGQKQTTGGKKAPVVVRQGNNNNNNNNNSANNSNNNRPMQQQQQQRVGLGQSPYGRQQAAPAAAPARVGNKNVGISLKTAEAISRDSSHPNRGEVFELLKTFERGWIDAAKFSALLSRLI
jgi:hypothetical protein